MAAIYLFSVRNDYVATFKFDAFGSRLSASCTNLKYKTFTENNPPPFKKKKQKKTIKPSS